jgi:hypothetical protein
MLVETTPVQFEQKYADCIGNSDSFGNSNNSVSSETLDSPASTLDSPASTRQFWSTVSPTAYVKILHSNLKQKKFQYKKGLNIDTIPFNPTGSCQPGGLYYTQFRYFTKFLQYGDQIALVELPDDAQIYAEAAGIKWKADKIIIRHIFPIADLDCWNDEQFCLDNFNTNEDVAKYAKETSLKRCMRFLKVKSLFLRHMKKPMPELLMYAIKCKKYAINFIANPTDEMRAYNKYMRQPRYFRKPLSECVKLLQQNVPNFNKVKKTKELLMLTLSNISKVYTMTLKNTSSYTEEILQQIVRNKYIMIDLQTDKCKNISLIIRALETSVECLRIIKQTPEMCFVALRANPKAINAINDKAGIMQKMGW